MSELTAEMIQRGPGTDPNALGKRRKLNQELRSMRERLTSSSGLQRAFDYELLRMYAHQRSGAALATMLLAAGIAVLGSFVVHIPGVVLWLLLMAAATGIQLLLSRHFLSLPEADVSLTSWRRRFILAELLSGAGWALIVGMLISLPGSEMKLFAFFIVLLTSAVTAMLSSSIPATIAAGMLPSAMVLIAASYPLRDLNTTFILAAGIGAQLYFSLLAHRQYSTSVATIEFRAEKDALIAELEQAKSNSDEARRRAEEANLAKSRFLATMSHELRTPLNAILGFSEVMKNELFGSLQVSTYKEYVADIHASGQHLLNLINEILDLSRVEAGRYELKEEAVNLAHLVEDCQHMLQLRAKSRGLTITLAVEPDLPKIWIDERAIRQVALNLLSNAIKFTPQGGQIDIKVGWTSAGGQYLIVKDNGPGIPEEEIPIVMQSFGRGSLAIKTAEQGSGLGLPIVKGLVDLHGGTFLLRSKLREGTEVIVTFPADRVMDTLAPLSDEAPSSQSKGQRAA